MKFLVALLCAVLTTSVMADEEVVSGVADRMTCADIQQRISELSSSEEEPDDSVLEEIAKLKADYRRSCTKSAGGRRTAAASRVVVQVNTNVVEDSDEKQDYDIEQEEIVEEVEVLEEVKTPEKVIKKQPKKSESEQTEEESFDDAEVLDSEQVLEQDLMETVEQELANLDSGLCADGTEPNKYGCCGSEIFKDLGGMVFACCPRGGGDCFPPIK